jgi:hypothetical protein
MGMLEMALERKQAKLHGAGGSRSVILPKDWLRDLGIDGDSEVELVRTADHIAVFPTHREAASIEDEPEFPRFLDFLAHSALAHPEHLGNVVHLLDEDADLVEGVPVEP